VTNTRSSGKRSEIQESGESGRKKEKLMKRNVGIWIDHRKAVIVSLGEKREEIREIPSGMEKHIRFSGGAQVASAEDQRDRRFTGHLDKYYDKVVSYIRDADSILILGPGEAKGEFEKHLRAESFGGRIAGIETTDKMSYDQLAAKVREHFLNSVDDIKKGKKI
jgi:stalled ribosome rescue protein Dom34